MVSCHIAAYRYITNWAISYVHGIMDGEAITDILESKDEGDIFRLR
jgi:hypothetical protein